MGIYNTQLCELDDAQIALTDFNILRTDRAGRGGGEVVISISNPLASF